MKPEVEKHPGFIVLRVNGNMRIWGRQELEKELLDTFRSALDGNPAQIVMNLAQVTAIDTLGIAALVRILIECSRRQMELKLVMPAGTPGEAIRCVRVFEPWPEYKSEGEAVEAAKAWSAAGSP